MAQSLEDVAALGEEIADRFGPLPPGVEALLAVQRLRVRLRALSAGQVMVRGGRVAVGPVSLTSQQLRGLRVDHTRAMYDSRENSVSVPAPSAPIERVAAAEELLAALAGALAPV